MLTFLSFGAREPAHFSSNKTIKASEFRKGSPVLKVQDSLLRRGSLCLCVCVCVSVSVWRGGEGKESMREQWIYWRDGEKKGERTDLPLLFVSLEACTEERGMGTKRYRMYKIWTTLFIYFSGGKSKQAFVLNAR